MTRTIAAALLLATTAALPARAAPPVPILSAGPDQGAHQEYVNKAVGLSFHRTLFSQKEPQLAADLYMDPAFVNHDIEEPSGAQAFADFFIDPIKNGNWDKTPLPKPKAPDAIGLRKLFVLTDGTMTMMAYATGGDGDPGARFGSNMFEVKKNRVTQWWYSGPANMARMPAAPAGPPPGAAPAGAAPAAMVFPKVPADVSRWYPVTGDNIAGMPTIIPLGEAPRATVEANKKLVAEFWDAFFTRHDKAAAARYLSADVKSHVEGLPSGAGFADAAAAAPETATTKRPGDVLFLLGQGELVDIGFAVPVQGDPGGWYAQNLVRVKDAKIVEFWYSGYPEGVPRHARPGKTIPAWAKGTWANRKG